jgi:protein-S-isoprenylcysteine O-methyltransferase Ste14
MITKVLIGLLFLVIIIFSVNSNWYNFFQPIFFLEHKYLVYLGLVVINLALVWMVIGQSQMSTSWRIGIDEVNKTALKTKGVFSVRRNPIFLGMLLSVVGLLIILPNALLLGITFTTYIVIQIQIRL